MTFSIGMTLNLIHFWFNIINEKNIRQIGKQIFFLPSKEGRKERQSIKSYLNSVSQPRILTLAIVIKVKLKLIKDLNI